MRFLNIIFLSFLLLATAGHAQTDLREYLPASGSTVLKTRAGNDHARYTYYDNPTGYSGLYNGFFNQGKTGVIALWAKEYKINGAWCLSTNAVLFKADDKSVTEVGDWTVSTTPCVTDTAFGYKKNGVASGLVWSPVGGLVDGQVATNEVAIYRQNSPGQGYNTYGYEAYSKSGIVAKYPAFTPVHDNTRGMWLQPGTYNDVIQVVMYHGTRLGESSPSVRCENKTTSTQGAYYQSFKNYNSYGIVLWLAKGIGVIQERLLYVEDATYWGIPNCSGYPFKMDYSWPTSIQF